MAALPARAAAAGVAAMLVLHAAAPVAAQAPAVTEGGRLVVIGGALDRDNEAIYRAILDRREGDGSLCVVPTASATPAASAASAVERFDRFGGAGTAAAVLITVDEPAAVSDPVIARRIRDCSGFFFTGGVQSRILSAFRPGGVSTPAYEALLSRHAEGAVISGSSAGAAIMSDPMIAGGSSASAMRGGVRRDDDGRDDDGRGDDPGDDADAGVLLTAGLGFFPAALFDQHFLARGRVARLVIATLDADAPDLGFGIDENTALVVEGGSARAVGASGVLVIDASDAVVRGRSATGVRLHLLADGDTWDVARRTFTPAHGLEMVAPPAQTVEQPADPFGRSAFLHTLDAFSGSTLQELELVAGDGSLVLRKTPGFAAWRQPGAGATGLRLTGLSLDLHRH
jgi:cyanophycinase